MKYADYTDVRCQSIRAKGEAESHLQELESKMQDLTLMVEHLRGLIQTCPAGSGQKCKVMFALSDDETAPVMEAAVQ